MVNVSILQSEDCPGSSITLPDSFVALKNTNTTSDLFFQVLDQSLKDEKRQVLKELKGLAAAEVADFLDELIMIGLNDQPKFRSRTIRTLRSLCGSWGILPASYTLEGEVTVDSKCPWTCAGFGEIWYGTWGSEKVAVKVIKITSSADPEKLKKQFSKEAIIWGQLKHRNLLPLYGVSAGIKITGIDYEHPCLVSPWMENGNIRVFVRTNPTVNRFKLLADVCEGLGYLHSEGFVHGDLKGDNVLVDREGRTRLADFGFAGVCVPFGVTGASNSSDVGGTTAYMAPELLVYRVKVSGGRSRIPPPKKPVDVYALGMLIYEVLAGQQPFHGIHREAIKSYVVNGDRPKLPPWTPIPNHSIWSMVQLCWRREPAERPQLAIILRLLTLSSLCVRQPREWPSPPITASTPSIPSSSPRVTPLLPASEPLDLPPVTPNIPTACPGYTRHPPPTYTVHGFHLGPPIPPPVSRLPSFHPAPPTPATTLRRSRGPRPVAVEICFDAALDNPVFRWVRAGGGIVKQHPGAANRRNP